MPVGTARYRFEFALLEWAEGLALRMCGFRCAFFVAFHEDATLRRVYFASAAEPFDGTRKAQLAGGHARWFLYLPYDSVGSAFVEWERLDRRVVERWLGRRLEPHDFLDVRTSGGRDDWPESWRVIVA